MLKIGLNFEKNATFKGKQLECLGLRIQNFQSIVFIPTQTYSEIFKSA